MVLSCPDGVLKFTVAKTCKIDYTSSILIEKEKKMTEFEKQCYGMSQADIHKQYMEGLTARLSGLEMVVMSILSDAQELQSFNHAQALDQSRQYMNRAKFILGEMMDQRRSAELLADELYSE
jgi:hypothetical protein